MGRECMQPAGTPLPCTPAPPAPLPLPHLGGQIVFAPADHERAGDEVLASWRGLADLWGRRGSEQRGRGKHRCAQAGRQTDRASCWVREHSGGRTAGTQLPAALCGACRGSRPAPCKRAHTCSGCTHHAEVTTLASQAALRHTQACPACEDGPKGGGGHRRVRRHGAPPGRRSTALPLRCGQLAPQGPRRPPFWHPAACTPLPLRDACLGERERRDGVCRREVLDDGGGGAVQVSVLRAGCVCTRRACVAGRVAGGALEGRGNLSRRQHSSPPHHVGIALAHVSLDQQLVLLSVPPRQHKVVLWARRGRGEVSAACEGGGQARARSQAVALAAGAWQAMRRSPASQPLQGRQPHPHPRR